VTPSVAAPGVIHPSDATAHIAIVQLHEKSRIGLLDKLSSCLRLVAKSGFQHVCTVADKLIASSKRSTNVIHSSRVSFS